MALTRRDLASTLLASSILGCSASMSIGGVGPDGAQTSDSGDAALTDEQVVADSGDAALTDEQVVADSGDATLTDEQVVPDAGDATAIDRNAPPVDSGPDADSSVADAGNACAHPGSFSAPSWNTLATEILGTWIYW